MNTPGGIKDGTWFVVPREGDHGPIAPRQRGGVKPIIQVPTVSGLTEARALDPVRGAYPSGA